MTVGEQHRPLQSSIKMRSEPPPPGEFDRTPPQDIAAEQSVLGGMMLSKDAIADVIEHLRSGDFYRPAHSIIFDAILDMYGRGDPADAITVAAALADAGELSRIGGAPYLHTLISMVPTAANSSHYARIVAERAILRRLVEAGTRIVQLGYGSASAGRDVDDVVDMAQQSVYEVTERRTSDDFTVLAELLQPTMDEIEAIGTTGGVMSGVPTGFVDLDRLTNGLHPGQLIIIAARPGLGKSTVSLDIARSAAIRHGLPSVIFSLEMSKIEITMRLLAAEARVPLHNLRTGRLSDDDWTKLARRMGEVSEAPLFIDDSPNMTMMEIRAKARRLKQRNDLRLIVLDYLQLMTSAKRVENRQQEVAELSRGLKLLAKELEVPVIGVSQLNRGPEQRTDKRPQLSDLRESGCLTRDTRIIRADTGAQATLGELLECGVYNIPIWSLDESLRYVPRPMTHVFPTGVKEVFALRLASGKEVKLTGNHPLLTLDGWQPVKQLKIGNRIAVPRYVPAPITLSSFPDDQVILLAHLIGDGSFVKRQPIRYASKDEECISVVAGAAQHFGISAIRDDYEVARCTTLRLPAPFRLARGRRNPIAVWLDELGLFGLRSHEKFIPDVIFSLSKQQVALFLSHLWATDGCVWWDERSEQARIYYASTSRRLVEDVSRLLLRFGINSRLKHAYKEDYRTSYQLQITGGDDQLRFLRGVGVFGGRAVQAARCQQELTARSTNTNRDTIPIEIWGRVKQSLQDQGITHRKFAAALGTAFCGSTLWKHAPSRQRIGRIAAVLDDVDLELLATNDVYWDEIVSLQSLGEQEVFDATVAGTHNFIADGVAVHNSIEQDSDVVILLHREDYYERESPRAGEADFIVAKHRNGPTDTITVAFQGHFSRFVDMSPGA